MRFECEAKVNHTNQGVPTKSGIVKKTLAYGQLTIRKADLCAFIGKKVKVVVEADDSIADFSIAERIKAGTLSFVVEKPLPVREDVA